MRGIELIGEAPTCDGFGTVDAGARRDHGGLRHHQFALTSILSHPGEEAFPNA